MNADEKIYCVTLVGSTILSIKMLSNENDNLQNAMEFYSRIFIIL